MTSSASTDRLTHDQIKAAIASALTSEAASVADREGASLYDRAGDLIKSLSQRGMSEEIVDTLTQIGRENIAKDADWWLRFLSLFDNVRLMTTAQRIAISDALTNYPPRDSAARAYTLRFLAYSGCPIAWERLSESFNFPELARSAPLVFTDALVWAQKYGDALDVISAYLRAGGSKDLVAQMLERWSDLEPVQSSNHFLESVEGLLADESAESLLRDEGRRFSGLEEFGQSIKEVSSGYDVKPFLMVPEAAE